MTILKRTVALLLAVMLTLNVTAQERKVQNRPYTDLRPFHFGIQIGTHMQDIELMNVGLLSITDEDGITKESLITCDQDQWDPGFNVGVLGEFRLTENLQFRIAPAIYFGARHFMFRNITESTPDDVVEEHQDLKSAYITSAFDIIFAAPRLNNHRMYVMAGLTPTLNLTGKTTDYFRLKRVQTFAEVGLGCDYYLPYFKCRPELKFMLGLGNALDPNHPAQLKDINMLAYAKSVSKAKTKMITLTFYFE